MTDESKKEQARREFLEIVEAIHERIRQSGEPEMSDEEIRAEIDAARRELLLERAQVAEGRLAGSRAARGYDKMVAADELEELRRRVEAAEKLADGFKDRLKVMTELYNGMSDRQHSQFQRAVAAERERDRARELHAASEECADYQQKRAVVAERKASRWRRVALHHKERAYHWYRKFADLETDRAFCCLKMERDLADAEKRNLELRADVAHKTELLGRYVERAEAAEKTTDRWFNRSVVLQTSLDAALASKAQLVREVREWDHDDPDALEAILDRHSPRSGDEV